MGKIAENIVLQRKSFGKVLGKFLKFWEIEDRTLAFLLKINLFYRDIYATTK